MKGGFYLLIVLFTAFLTVSGSALLQQFGIPAFPLLSTPAGMIGIFGLALFVFLYWFPEHFPQTWIEGVDRRFQESRKTIRRLGVVVAIVIVDLIMVQYFNTLVWPYLWPRPGAILLVVVVVLMVCLPEWFAGIRALRIVGLGVIFVGECYLLHSFEVMIHNFSVVSLFHFVGIAGVFIVVSLSYVNQIRPKDNRTPPRLPEELPHVAAVIPTYGEPVNILEQTVVSLLQLDYPADRLYIVISDDGHRAEVEALAQRHGLHYNRGARKDAKAGNLNSALEHLDTHFPQATLVLTQDADEVIDASFLKKTVGYFVDADIAFVQTPKDAIAPPGDPFGVRDRMFYDAIQPGRNGTNAAFSCGSGVVWRISAVKSIGGFATWNIVEDLTTSYFLHRAGYRSEYHNEILTIGLAPDDIPGLLKQRGTWATDTWRLFLFNNPLFQPGLSLRQRLQYTELGLFYATTAFFMPLLMLVPVMSLATGNYLPIEGSALFPWLVFSFLYYIVMARGNVEVLKLMWQYWIGHFATYHKAFWIAVRSRNKKPSYKVTRKTRQAGFYGSLLWPQFLYLFVGSGLIVYSLLFTPPAPMAARLTNISILLFFMFMVSGICIASFYGVALPKLAIRRPLLGRLADLGQIALNPIGKTERTSGAD